MEQWDVTSGCFIFKQVLRYFTQCTIHEREIKPYNITPPKNLTFKPNKICIRSMWKLQNSDDKNFFKELNKWRDSPCAQREQYYQDASSSQIDLYIQLPQSNFNKLFCDSKER